MDNNNLEADNSRSAATGQLETQISVVEIINMMLTFWWLIALMAVLVGGSTYLYSKLTSIPQYKSTGTLYISTQKEQKTDDVNTTALTGAKNLMPTYIEILKAKPFLQTVSDDIDNKYSWSEITENTTIENIKDTNMISIRVKCEDSHDAYLICSSIVNNAFDEIIRVFDGGSVKLIDIPEEAPSPESTNSLKRGIIGFLAGAAVAMLIIFLINMFDTRVKNSDELRRKYNLPILGEVADLHQI